MEGREAVIEGHLCTGRATSIRCRRVSLFDLLRRRRQRTSEATRRIHKCRVAINRTTIRQLHTHNTSSRAVTTITTRCQRGQLHKLNQQSTQVTTRGGLNINTTAPNRAAPRPIMGHFARSSNARGGARREGGSKQSSVSQPTTRNTLQRRPRNSKATPNNTSKAIRRINTTMRNIRPRRPTQSPRRTRRLTSKRPSTTIRKSSSNRHTQKTSTKRQRTSRKAPNTSRKPTSKIRTPTRPSKLPRNNAPSSQPKPTRQSRQNTDKISRRNSPQSHKGLLTSLSSRHTHSPHRHTRTGVTTVQALGALSKGNSRPLSTRRASALHKCSK